MINFMLILIVIVGVISIGAYIRSFFVGGKNYLQEYNEKINEIIRESNLEVIKSDYINKKTPYDDKYFGKVLLSEDRKNIYLINLKDSNKINKINYKDILESHILEDNVSITKTSRKSQIGGAILGSVIAGGVGGIIGGLSGKQTQENKVRKIELVIVMNDEIDPVVKFTFLDTVNPADKNNDLYKYAYEKTYNWHKTISVMINKADKDAKQTV